MSRYVTRQIYWGIVSALSVGLVEAGNMASGSWCDSAFTKHVPWMDDGDSSSNNEEKLMLLYSNYLLFCSSCSAISPHAVSFKLLSLYSSKSVFHSSGRVLTASINCFIINNKNSNPTSCKELQHETARQRASAHARGDRRQQMFRKDRSRSDSADSSVDVCGVCEVLRGRSNAQSSGRSQNIISSEKLTSAKKRLLPPLIIYISIRDRVKNIITGCTNSSIGQYCAQSLHVNGS
ncbi:hypothetical protein J6590_004458 [Homalodisca vitripennis]|nr:hypothetical protein J6590_004458 [Homalodisca vitripennis]